MRLRWAAVVAVALVCGALPAHGAARACRLVEDVLGDDSFGVTAADSPYDDPNLDLVSADVATNASAVAVAARVVHLDDWDLAAPTGRLFVVEFDAHRVVQETKRLSGGRTLWTTRHWSGHLYLAYLDRPGWPGRVEWGYYLPTFGYTRGGPAHGVLDLDGHQVRMWAPLPRDGDFLRHLGSRDTVIGQLRVTSYRHLGDPTGQVDDPSGLVGTPRLLVDSDTAASDALYRSGTPSCLPIGR